MVRKTTRFLDIDSSVCKRGTRKLTRKARIYTVYFKKQAISWRGSKKTSNSPKSKVVSFKKMQRLLNTGSSKSTLT
jgi:hypothetical protein